MGGGSSSGVDLVLFIISVNIIGVISVNININITIDIVGYRIEFVVVSILFF